jgi:general secretion pathway protein E
MSASPKSISLAKTVHEGPVDWRRLVEWLQADGVISAEEAGRTVARCSRAESAQHPLLRLASVAMRRAADGKALDIETLTQWLAGRAGLDYLRIDPLKVDVGKVADVMSAAYAERHRVLPVQVTPSEVVVATAEPFLHDWVSEVERQSRRTVRRVLANPQDIHRYTAEFFALAKSVRAAQKAGAVPAAPASSSWWNWARATSSSMPTTRVWCRWWTGCGSTPSTSAPATFTWSRGASRA